jgi:hypothetical protein
MLSVVPSQSSSVPGLAQVSVPLGVVWTQAPHVLVDLLPDMTQGLEPAAQMPFNPVEQAWKELAEGH